MKHGDLSAEVPPRLLVTLELVSHTVPKVKKRMGLFPTVTQQLVWEALLLSQLFDWSWNRGVNLELVVIGRDEDPVELDRSLDEWGTNPFTWIREYDSVEELVNDLPYRRDLYGVLDIPERAGRYGSYYLDLEQLP